jgi:hypothetical protein
MFAFCTRQFHLAIFLWVTLPPIEVGGYKTNRQMNLVATT